MKKRIKRRWNKKFQKYMKYIVNHPNYAGMPELYKKDGSIRWVTTAKSKIGQMRLVWWDKKREEKGFKKEGSWISKVARTIHPLGKKPCQICGKEMSLDYIYPNKRGGKSPGAMSDAPDRFDGFHTYNLCCRSRHDIGRHKDNLSRYGEDRRAYENWSDGDWKAASWLMKEFNKHKISADHIGPISLGFAHRPKFNPSTTATNAAKNNRMTLKDVYTLIEDENNGATVVSWHSKYLWDKLKGKVRADKDAKILSKTMRVNMHCVLTILAEISAEGYDDYLVKYYLHPEHAFYSSIKYVGFNPKDGSYTKMEKIRGDKKQYHNNAKRYLRISIESLKKYKLVKNRKVKALKSKKMALLIKQTMTYLKAHNYREADFSLKEAIKELAEELSRGYQSTS